LFAGTLEMLSLDAHVVSFHQIVLVHAHEVKLFFVKRNVVRIAVNDSSYKACYVWASPFPILASAETFQFLINSNMMRSKI
jgi:hypothetical protein